ncbi:Cyclodipeptide synthase [Gracilaria domingensis]|nr:Cyclodipeptide synthase [Gracilaria domingensis]
MSKVRVSEPEGHQEAGLHFLFDVNEEMLNEPGVFVTISVLTKSPLMEPNGARSVVQFLESLPYPSLVVIVDSPLRHDIMAIKKKSKSQEICPEKARQTALELGNVYVKSISDAIDTSGSEKITVIRWDDMLDENKAKQELIIHEYYNRNTSFRQRIDEIAMEFINRRAPNSRFMAQRMSHAVNFILDELPPFVTGLLYKQKRYVTNVYATSTTSMAGANANPHAFAFASHTLVKDIQSDPMFADLKKNLVEADNGMEAPNGLAILVIAPKNVDNMKGC